MRGLAALVATLALAGSLLAARAGDMQLRRDGRISIVEPPERATVKGPFELDWRAEGIPAGGAFAVFVDRPPLRPGQGLDALARRDPHCRRDPSCPDRAWLAVNRIHITRRTRIDVAPLSRDGGRAAGGRRRHELTIVLLDRHGRRRGEGAWRRVVFTREPGS